MKIISSTNAQNGFGKILKEINNKLVTVTKNNKPIAMVVSIQDYRDLIRHNEEYWERAAGVAMKKGFLSNEELLPWLEDRLEVIGMNGFHMSIKVSYEFQSFCSTLTNEHFRKIMNAAIVLNNPKQNKVTSGFNRVDIGRLRLFYDFFEEDLRLIYIDRK
jgi:prevent-host-death family protein